MASPAPPHNGSRASFPDSPSCKFNDSTDVIDSDSSVESLPSLPVSDQIHTEDLLNLQTSSNFDWDQVSEFPLRGKGINSPQIGQSPQISDENRDSTEELDQFTQEELTKQAWGPVSTLGQLHTQSHLMDETETEDSCDHPDGTEKPTKSRRNKKGFSKLRSKFFNKLRHPKEKSPQFSSPLDENSQHSEKTKMPPLSKRAQSYIIETCEEHVSGEVGDQEFHLMTSDEEPHDLEELTESLKKERAGREHRLREIQEKGFESWPVGIPEPPSIDIPESLTEKDDCPFLFQKLIGKGHYCCSYFESIPAAEFGSRNILIVKRYHKGVDYFRLKATLHVLPPQTGSEYFGGFQDFVLLPQRSFDHSNCISFPVQRFLTLGSFIYHCSTLDFLSLGRILRDCAKGLVFLHSHGLIHGNIRPQNILVCIKPNSRSVCNPTGKLFDLDFGLEQKAYNKTPMKSKWSTQCTLQTGEVTPSDDCLVFLSLVQKLFCALPLHLQKNELIRTKFNRVVDVNFIQDLVSTKLRFSETIGEQLNCYLVLAVLSEMLDMLKKIWPLSDLSHKNTACTDFPYLENVFSKLSNDRLEDMAFQKEWGFQTLEDMLDLEYVID